ncbi:MAG: pyruvate kinase [Clostridia bacterium]|nr:pyruvate kinase [Clostridia bacterium]
MKDVRRRTKIVCTMGPRLFENDLIRPLMLAGMDVARFNFSHGTHETHRQWFNEVCRIRDELGLPVATMLDTKGPEIRTGDFEGGRVVLEPGQLFTLHTEECLGDAAHCSITYRDLPRDVNVGDSILIDDGLIAMTVEHITETEITCKVLNGGPVSNHKGINVPNVHLSMPFISPKDREDILFAVENGFDFIAASFVRSAEDIVAIRKILQERENTSIRIIAKIENHEGVQNLDEIMHAADGIMVARGDMGVEIPLEEVPGLQKHIIHECVMSGRPVITATQMLDSMIKNPRPTRAEATDVANAIYDGTSAIMLSGETAAGLYPIEAVQTMVRIAKKTEADIDYVHRFAVGNYNTRNDITAAISHATVTSSHDLHASAIITVTKGGGTARMIARYRPNCPIVACATSPTVYHQLNLSWGVIPMLIDEVGSTDELFDAAVEASSRAGIIHDGELVVLTAGVPLGISGTTNMMKVHVVGHMLLRATGVGNGTATAPLYVAGDISEALENFRTGQILVCKQTTKALLPLVRKASGLILEDPDMEGQGVIAGLSLDIPVIIGATGATRILSSGAVVTISAADGTVSCN